MNPEPQLALGTDAERYGALFRISEALSVCGETEQLARVLGDQLRGLISFDHLDVLILKENSCEIGRPFSKLFAEPRTRWLSIARTGNSGSTNSNWRSRRKVRRNFLRCAIRAGPPATWRC